MGFAGKGVCGGGAILFVFFFSPSKLHSVAATRTASPSKQAEKLAALSRPGRDSRLEGPTAKRRGGLAVSGVEAGGVGGWGGRGAGRREGKWEMGEGGGSHFQKGLSSFIPKN